MTGAGTAVQCDAGFCCLNGVNYVETVLPLQRRQGCSGNALPDSLEMIVCCMELDVLELGELCLQDLLGSVKHEVATRALAHTAQDHYVVNLVELAVLRQSVAQVDTGGLVDLTNLRLLFCICHALLDQLQALGMVFMPDRAQIRMWINVIFRNVHAALCCELRHSTLPQIHMRHARVGPLGPRVGRRIRVQVEPDVTEFIDPPE